MIRTSIQPRNQSHISKKEQHTASYTGLST